MAPQAYSRSVHITTQRNGDQIMDEAWPCLKVGWKSLCETAAEDEDDDDDDGDVYDSFKNICSLGGGGEDKVLQSVSIFGRGKVKSRMSK